MRRIAFFVVFTCLIFSFGLASGQVAEITAEVTGGGWLGDINYFGEITIELTYTCTYDSRQLPTNSYELSSSDGATWANYDINLADPVPAGFGIAPGAFDNYLKDHPIGDAPDGVSPDVWGVGGITIFGAGWVTGETYGYPTGEIYDEVTYVITFETDGSHLGKHITLDQTTFTGFTWVWSQLEANPGPTVNLNPTFAASTWELVEIPDNPPEFTNLPTSNTLEGNHCQTFVYDFDAIDPDPPEEGPPNVLTFTTDLGNINLNTGEFSYVSSIDDVYETVVASITCTEDDNPMATTVAITLVATNEAPEIDDGFCGETFVVGVEKENKIAFTATDNCSGDPMNWYIVDDGGIDSIYFNGGNLWVYPLEADEGNVPIVIGVTDTKDAQECEVTLAVTAGFTVKIEKDEGTSGLGAYQGQFTDVDVYIAGYPEGMGGFDFLITYDASALTFMGANTNTSELYGACDWEYFEYRFGPFGNCGNGCPSGQVRVVGMAETNNGPDHPLCNNFSADSIAFTMEFLVSNDRTLNCSYVPIRFFWYDCGDNTVSNEDGSKLSISKAVYDYNGIAPSLYGEIIETPIEFPSFAGAEDECETSGGLDKPEVVREILFYNGGVDIICSEEIDDRGDINLDGLAYTIADAVMFTNYFVYGLNAFGYVDGAIAASDVNADGMTLTVADLVYLIRVIIGDAFPYPKVISTVSAEYWVENGVLSVDREMGAIYLELDRNADVVLLAEGMEMKADNGKVIVYSLEGNAVSGQVLRTDGKIVNIEMAAKDGSPVNGAEVPRNFSLSQNYPNPFNPETVIGFNLSEASDYSLTIYNVTGQVVDVFSGSADAGSHELKWNASNVASGIYFYKLDAGNFSETKKMILLK